MFALVSWSITLICKSIISDGEVYIEGESAFLEVVALVPGNDRSREYATSNDGPKGVAECLEMLAEWLTNRTHERKKPSGARFLLTMGRSLNTIAAEAA